MIEDLHHRMACLSYEETRPMSMMVELTYRCNQACRHCYIRGMDTSQELPVERFADIFSEAADEGIMFAALSGGEFMLRPDWRAVADRIKSLKLGLRLFTNLTHVDDETADYIADLGPVFIETTMFSGDPAVHDAFVRLPGAFDATVAAVKRLRARGIPVQLKHEVSEDTWPTFESLAKLADDLGTVFAHTIYIGPNLVGRPDPYEVRPSDETVRAYFEWKYNGAKKPRNVVEKDVCGDESAERRRMGRVVTCMTGRNSAIIGPDGTMYACALLRVPFGNVADAPFGEVWRSEAAERFRGYENQRAPECENCEYDAICQRCPGYSLLEDGGIERRSIEHCRIAGIEAEVIEKLTGVKVS
ncbi:MAG: radical SAM protein [Candidatus Coatesbacteria bacterium]|nr:MAG: radical SAM protein [Candidatus Coatesbacteria bacterium]